MLNHAKVLKELERVAHDLFFDVSDKADVARHVWKKIADDITFAHTIKTIQTPWVLPSWSGRLDDAYRVEHKDVNYSVLGIDGSQIYPDKHQGTSCSLINLGVVHLRYGIKQRSSVQFFSEPVVFAGNQDVKLRETPQELVNCTRQELEFAMGVQECTVMKQESDDTKASLFLFDGSLIFWHLESKDKEVKIRFLTSYLDSLETLYEQKVLMAGYISLTKSKELVNLIRVALAYCADSLGIQEYVASMNDVLDYMTDAHIVHFFLKPFTRTTVFKNHAAITKQYPHYLHPCFFYLHVGSEIARVELPAWIACQDDLVQCVASLIVDQVVKGDGYPVALAEAHEQAVVKGADREFFYHMIKKIGQSKQYQGVHSKKVMKKRGIRI